MKAAQFYAAPLALNDTHNSLIEDSSRRLLIQLASLIAELDEVQYGQSSDGKAPSIGKHVRHIIEFYSEFFSFLESTSHTPLCYDMRQRDPKLETSRNKALERIAVIADQLDNAPKEHQDLRLASTINPQQQMYMTSSSVHRELVYLFDHTVHHMALIKIFAGHFGVNLDHEFGLAPSTLAYETHQQSS